MRAMNLARREETGAVRVKTEQFQVELDRLGATLRQVEDYNERVKGEIAVTRRATYAAEEAISKMEKEKKEQDLLIDQLQVGGWGSCSGVSA
jgi:phage-related tail protein